METEQTHQTEASIATLLAGALPGVEWVHGDDLCDCKFQRIGEWTNPFLGSTHRVRHCCFEKKLLALLPELAEFVQDIDAFYDYNAGVFVEGVYEWASLDADMPRAIWYRQLAALTGKPLGEIRNEYADQEPPKRLIPAPTEAQLAAIANAPTTRRKRFFGLF